MMDELESCNIKLFIDEKKESKNNLFYYSLAMYMAESMLAKGIISLEEYNNIELNFCKKYCISLASIFRKNHWI